MLKVLWIAAIALATASNAQAQATKSVVVASNGIEVTVYSDEFANRYEYSAPAIEADDGTILVATVKKGGVAPPPHLTGFFIYSGEWRRYSTAIFRGGDVADFVETGRDVGRCYSSRYSRTSCTLTESFKISLSSEQARKYGQDGSIALQVRAQDTSTTIFEVPTAYIEAVSEVAAR